MRRASLLMDGDQKFDVILEGDEKKRGTLDEEFAAAALPDGNAFSEHKDGDPLLEVCSLVE
jgi:hypothetical protein